MQKRIVVIDGHPDPDPARFCHAIAQAYEDAATKAGHHVRRLNIAHLEFPILRTRTEWENHQPVAVVRDCQEALKSAHHVVLIYPLWLGDVPALLKAFFEQVLRPGFAIQEGARTLSPGLLKGKSAHVIVTMGMPGFVYRIFFFAHSVRSLRRNILKFVGLGPIRQSIIGNVEGDASGRSKWLDRVRSAAKTPG